MDILVDYNNVPEIQRRRGAMFVVDKIVNALGSAHLAHTQRVSFRLYDGWYENQSPTRRAQQVAAEVQQQTPRAITLGCGLEQTKIIVNVELAYSLKAAPAQHIWHTYRPRYYPGDVKFRDPRTAGCSDPDCPLVAMYRLFQDRHCPQAGCELTPEAFLYRSEQKLVDTMMAADLFSLHLQSSKEIVVVTSDDDLWPAIKLVLQLGIRVFHIHTLPGRRTPPFYCRSAGSDYIQLEL